MRDFEIGDRVKVGPPSARGGNPSRTGMIGTVTGHENINKSVKVKMDKNNAVFGIYIERLTLIEEIEDIRVVDVSEDASDLLLP